MATPGTAIRGVHSGRPQPLRLPLAGNALARVDERMSILRFQVEGVRWNRNYPHIRYFDQLGCTLLSEHPNDLEVRIHEALESPRLRARRQEGAAKIALPPLADPPARIANLIRSWLGED